MAFRRSDLQEAFCVPGTHAFRVWGYGTADPLEAVLAPGYFALARSMLRPGELIYVSAGSGRGEQTRQALVMVRADEGDAERADGAVRLVQDFGGPGDPAPATAIADAAAPAPPAPARRGRGRPPGSRTRKPAATPAENPPDLAPPA
jgi:hypothetical protein